MKNPFPNTPRRSFIKKSALSAIGLTGLVSANSQIKLSKMKLPEQLTVVFQGDSITDGGRNKESQKANDFENMGGGYALMASAELMGGFPQTDWKLYNRGISGNKVYQLSDRWDKDCLDLKPDVVSILIGVNDYWHTFKHGFDGTAASYEQDLDALLKRTKKALPGVKIIIGEPFALKEGSAIREIDNWYPEFLKYQTAAKNISKKHQTAWIPYQDILNKASKDVPQAHWSRDGVHPSFAGCHLMAQGWVGAFNSLYE